MKINNNYELKFVLDSYILINNLENSNSIIKLNETSKDIFELVANNKNIDEIVSILLDKYDTDKETLIKDVNDFINDMLIKGIFING